MNGHPTFESSLWRLSLATWAVAILTGIICLRWAVTR